MSTQTETAQAWERRKKRINYENLFIIMYDRDGLTEDDYNKLKRFKCKNKILLSDKEENANYPFIKKMVKKKDDMFLDI